MYLHFVILLCLFSLILTRVFRIYVNKSCVFLHTNEVTVLELLINGIILGGIKTKQRED